MLGWIGRALMPWRKKRPLVAAVRLGGVIAAGGRFGSGLSLGALAGALDAAFSAPVQAVALLVNSPGGSPVQSHLLFKRIRALAAEKKRPVIAFVEDVAASGGYMLACAADEIFADESSIVGSIGVISAGFGFHGAIEKLGIERRVHSAGTRKSMLDPFRPEDPGDVAHLEAIQRDVHLSFIALVKDRRGSRLKGTNEELFSGEFWAGRQGLERGLIDAIGDVKSVMRERYGEDVRIVPFQAPRPRFLRPARSGVSREWPALLDESLSLIEARSLWSRFGL